MTAFDIENRPIAEMQQTIGTDTAVWSDAEESFIVENSSPVETIPTKLYTYDADGRLVAVELPAVADPNNSGAITRPKYEYAYDERGNQTLIRDPNGNETRFTFSDRGQQATRTLPLGFGSDGRLTQGEAPNGDFVERFEYDDEGRQEIHVSFEGVVTENVYDDYGRLSAMNYYIDETAYAGGTGNPTEQWQYSYDEYGRKDVAVRSADVAGTLIQNRIEETIYDDRGRIIHEISDEGVVSYGYDSFGRMTFMSVNATHNTQSDLILTSVDNLPADPSTAERVTRYDYDILGRLVSVSEDATPANPNDDPLVETDYAFDLQGRMDTMSTSGQTAASVTTDYDYDQLGRLHTINETDQAGNTLASYDYGIRIDQTGGVRADGKRTSLDETHWLDTNSNDAIDAGELKTTSYDWTYDDAGRLTDEVINHWDDDFDQTESFEYDLTGNRYSRTVDFVDALKHDEAFTYDYNANDQLTFEYLDNDPDSEVDQTTAYVYDQTQQIDKTVTDTNDSQTNFTIDRQRFRYNLQGRMSGVANEQFDALGGLIGRTRTLYEYDSKSFRIKLVNATDTDPQVETGMWDDSAKWTLNNSVEFLADHHNHTGYTQTIRETEYDDQGVVTKTIDYTFGHDEIQPDRRRRHDYDNARLRSRRPRLRPSSLRPGRHRRKHHASLHVQCLRRDDRVAQRDDAKHCSHESPLIPRLQWRTLRRQGPAAVSASPLVQPRQRTLQPTRPVRRQHAGPAVAAQIRLCAWGSDTGR